jgi:hypothetical protein
MGEQAYTADLVHSVDDENRTGKGWYWHAYFADGTDRVSRQSWRTAQGARTAMARLTVKWRKN